MISTRAAWTRVGLLGLVLVGCSRGAGGAGADATATEASVVTVASASAPVVADAAIPKVTKPGRARCLEVAAAVVMALPEVKKTLSGAEKEIAKAHDGRRMGGMGPQDDEGPGLSVSLGVHHADRYERLVDYEVDAAGKLTVTVAADEIAVPAAAASKVEQACKAL